MSRLIGTLVTLAALIFPAVTHAAVTRVEVESLPAPAVCWGTTSWQAFSGGSSRTCGWTANAPLRWTVDSDGSAVVRLYGYRDTLPRGYRVRVDAGAWTTGTLGDASSATAPSALFHTSPTLTSGSHTFELEWASDYPFTIDYYEVESGGTAPPPPPPAPKAVCEDGVDNDSDGKIDYPNDPGCSSLSDSDEYDAPPASGTCTIEPADGQDAIMAAIRDCPDGTATSPTIISFPTGKTYHVTNSIHVGQRNGLTIDGNGSVFLKTDPNTDGESQPIWRLLEGSHITLQDMVIDGQQPLAPLGITPGNQFNHGVSILGGTGHAVRAPMTIRNVFGDLVTVAPSGQYLENDVTKGQIARDVLIEGVQGYNAARMCIAPTGGIGIRVEDNTLRHCRYGGIDMETEAPGEKLQNVKVLRNTIDGATATSEFATWVSAIIVVGPSNAKALPDDMSGFEIRGNRILKAPETCYPAITVSEQNTERGPISNVTIADNTMLTQSHGVSVNDVNTGAVTGNDITLTRSPGWCGPPASVPVRVLRSTGITVSTNTSHGY